MTARLPLSPTQIDALSRMRIDGVAVDTPRYTRVLRHRICHLGVGAFHRAHQACVLHRLLQQGLADGWGLCGIGLRAADQPLIAALRAQSGLYSLWEVDGDQRRVSIIGSIMELIDASLDVVPALAALAHRDTRIVTLTVTEAGYCLDRRGALDADHPDVAHDLATPSRPRSVPGVLVTALDMRRTAGLGGLGLLSCDNLLENGKHLRSAVLGLAQRLDPELADWITQHCSFPCSMVDRITPAPDAARHARYAADWSVDDAAMVICEPWLQWVLEDDFVAGRPPFEHAGAHFSHEVARWEEAKVGLLNGGHSAISHLGLMRGHVRVHDALADTRIRSWHAGYMAEVAQTLAPLDGLDMAAYQATLTRRFSNAALDDRLLRLAMDSSSKFPQVLVPPALRRLERGQSIPHLATAIALWIVYLAELAGREHDAGYVDHDTARLIADAVRAVATFDATIFVSRTLPLPHPHDAAFIATLNIQLRALVETDADAVLAQLAHP